MDVETDNIELRSEEFQEVLGRIPNWMLRWGITILASLTLLFLIGSAFFKYPDIISTAMTLTGSTPTAAVVAKISGRLDSLYVRDNQNVRSGEYLAVIENSAKTEDVLLLQKYLASFVISKSDLSPVRNLCLGNMQSTYAVFCSTLFNYKEFIRSGFYSAKKKFIQNRIAQGELQYRDIVRQKDIAGQQLELVTKQFIRDSILYREGALSDEKYGQSRNDYLQERLVYENIQVSLNNISMQVMQMKETLLDVEQQFVEKENIFLTQLNLQMQQLNNEIRDWEMTYVILAPISGKITFTTYWVKNQNISAGEEIFNIIPTDRVELVGKALLPIARSGKVKVGQNVNIRFENFPENEFGMVNGTVKNISLVPIKTETGSYYVVEVIFQHGLQTTYKKELPFLHRMNARADIITEQMSLLERFFMPLRKLWNEQLMSN